MCVCLHMFQNPHQTRSLKILPHQTPRITRTRNTETPPKIPINNNLELPLIISNPKKNLEKTSVKMMNTTSSSVSVKKKMKNKIRFSDEQIRSLETMFDCETRIEPKKKLQLARELGLQPRQVAIWFQNKRARWKSKQLERDYGILLANHNNLVSRFEVLKKEKQSLLIQLQKLKEIQEKAGRKESEVGNGGDENKKSETEVKPNLLERHVFSDEEENSERFGGDCFSRFEEENEMLKMVREAGVADSPEDWGSLDSEDLLNPPSTSYEWWDFWS